MIFLKYINYRVLLLLLLYVSFECVCVYLIERVCRARAENSEVVRWDRILLPKKGEEKPLFVVFAPGREKCFKKMHLVNSPISVLGCTKDAKRRRVIIKSCWILQYKIRSIEKEIQLHAYNTSLCCSCARS